MTDHPVSQDLDAGDQSSSSQLNIRPGKSEETTCWCYNLPHVWVPDSRWRVPEIRMTDHPVSPHLDAGDQFLQLSAEHSSRVVRGGDVSL